MSPIEQSMTTDEGSYFEFRNGVYLKRLVVHKFAVCTTPHVVLIHTTIAANLCKYFSHVYHYLRPYLFDLHRPADQWTDRLTLIHIYLY